MAEVEVRAIAVVEEDAVGRAVLKAQIKRDALINRVRTFMVAGRVRIPHRELVAPFVQPRGLLAESVKMLVEAETLCGGNRRAFRIEHHRTLVRVDDRVRARIAKLDDERP